MGNFIVFDCLGWGDEVGIEGGGVFVVFYDFFVFGDDVLDGFVCFVVGWFVEKFEYLFEVFDLFLGFVVVL